MCSSSRTTAVVPSKGQNGGMSLPSRMSTPASSAARKDSRCRGPALSDRSCIHAGTPSSSKKDAARLTMSVGTSEVPLRAIASQTSGVSS